MRQLASTWDAAGKDPLLHLLYQECWLRDRRAGLILKWRSESEYYRDVVHEKEEFSLRYYVERKADSVCREQDYEHGQRERPSLGSTQEQSEALLQEALLRSTRAVIADLIEQVLELPPSAEETDGE